MSHCACSWVGVAALLCLGTSGFAAAPQSIPETEQARRYFEEARLLWSRDGGRLWGRSLESPMLFADRQTRRVLANQKDEQGQLQMQDGVFIGRLPAEINVANNALQWAGVHWTMVAWPLPKDKVDRAVLMMHESWHRVQEQLGFPMTGPSNRHLDTLEGRYWLQLEWRALREALLHQGDQRRAAIQDGLSFRAYRRSLFKEAATQERALEMHEGLAEYTGVKLSGLTDAEQGLYVARILEQKPSEYATFVRSFAYVSGPAYGLLLDATGKDWRKDLKPADDLAVLLREALALTPPTLDKAAIEARSQQYDGQRLRAAEEACDRSRQRALAAARAKFVDGLLLRLPLQKMQMSFNPSGLQPLDSLGTVYATLRVSDVWGILTVSNGALMAADFSHVVVPAPSDAKARPLKGDGWELELKSGWSLQPGKRNGDYVLAKDP